MLQIDKEREMDSLKNASVETSFKGNVVPNILLSTYQHRYLRNSLSSGFFCFQMKDQFWSEFCQGLWKQS